VDSKKPRLMTWRGKVYLTTSTIFLKVSGSFFGEVGEDFSIELDIFLFERVYECAIFCALGPERGV